MELTNRQTRWYNMGADDAKQFASEDEALRSMDPETLSDMVTGKWSDETWYHAGFTGRTPEYVSAVRFGAIPADGRSINHADGTAENGVSCVKIIRNAEDASTSSIYDVTLGMQGIKKVTVSGWYLGGTGSDGEPLLIDAVED